MATANEAMGSIEDLGRNTYRYAVPGGWLYGRTNQGLAVETYVPDPAQWSIALHNGIATVVNEVVREFLVGYFKAAGKTGT